MQNYNPKNRGYIYESEFYQSWSETINGLDCVSNFNGKVLLLVSEAQYGIRIFGLLEYLITNNNICIKDNFKKPQRLLKYEEEEEIVYNISFDKLKTVATIDKEDLRDWTNFKEDIPKGKWRRKNIK